MSHLGPMMSTPSTSRISPSQFRSRFPIVNRRIYVNSCSQGALSTDVEAAMHEYAESWHDAGSPWDMWVDKVEQLRGRRSAGCAPGRTIPVEGRSQRVRRPN